VRWVRGRCGIVTGRGCRGGEHLVDVLGQHETRNVSGDKGREGGSTGGGGNGKRYGWMEGGPGWLLQRGEEWQMG
jgi:hypothetical protein